MSRQFAKKLTIDDLMHLSLSHSTISSNIGNLGGVNSVVPSVLFTSSEVLHPDDHRKSLGLSGHESKDVERMLRTH